MTITEIQKQTLTQKLLGRNYKWWYAVLYSFKLSYEYRINILIAIVRFFIPVVVTFSLLNLTSSNKSFSSYILIASIFYQFYAFVIGPSFDITNNVIKGDLSRFLLYPTGYLSFLITKILGFNFLTLMIRILVLFLSTWILGISVNFLSFFWALPFVIITVIIGFFIEVIVGSLVFFQHSLNKNFIPFYTDLMPFLSGSLIAFTASPSLKFLEYLPFAYFAHYPMQIYLGKYSALEVVYVFGGGIAWCIILYYLAKWVFRMGLKKNEAVGL